MLGEQLFDWITGNSNKNSHENPTQQELHVLENDITIGNMQLDIMHLQEKVKANEELVRHLITSVNNIDRHIDLADIKLDRLDSFRKDLTDVINSIQVKRMTKKKGKKK